MSNPPITILLASYNGAEYLGAQLESIAQQNHENWSLIVSDDGSSDDTSSVVQSFKKRYPAKEISFIEGPQKGATINFLSMLAHVPEGNYAALADQDDYWYETKLSRAVEIMSQRTGPTHYAARTRVCDENLLPLAEAPHFSRPLTFKNALIQACMPGNTSVFSPDAVRLLQETANAAIDADVLSHDWWCYLILSGAGATLVRDDFVALDYRQHEQNEVGRNDTFAAARARVAKLYSGEFRGWLDRNLQALEKTRGVLTADNQATLDLFKHTLQKTGPVTAWKMMRHGLYRQGAIGSLAFYLGVIAGRI